MNLLDNFLKTIGKKYEELNNSEKEVYGRWEEQLTKANEPITIENLKDFLIKEMEMELNQLLTSKVELSSADDIFIKSQMRTIKVILAFLNSPQEGARVLETMLARKIEQAKKQK